MKTLLVTVVLVLVGTFLGGCTMVETCSERNSRIANSWQLQSKMLVEDVDYALLLERPTLLTPWHVRTGLPD